METQTITDYELYSAEGKQIMFSAKTADGMPYEFSNINDLDAARAFAVNGAKIYKRTTTTTYEAV